MSHFHFLLGTSIVTILILALITSIWIHGRASLKKLFLQFYCHIIDIQ